MTAGAAITGQGGGPGLSFSTDEAVSLANDVADLTERLSVTYRMADHWCRSGVLGPALEQRPGSGNPRRFVPDDVLALAAVGRVRAVLFALGGNAPGTALYREVAGQVRSGRRHIVLSPLTRHVRLVVEVDDIAAVLGLLEVMATPTPR